MKPKKYSVFLASFLLLAAAPYVTNSVTLRPTVAFAEETAQIIAQDKLCDTIEWQLDSNGTLTITGSGDMSVINRTFSKHIKNIKKAVIRNTDDDNTITAIGASLFSECTNLKEVSLPDTIKVIGNRAFCESGLTEITLPGCELGSQSFMDCTSLKKVIFSEGTETIPTECFRNCTALESVVLPDSVKLIDATSNTASGAFYYCLNLKNVSIGKNIENIQNNAFHTCGNELEITFRDGVTAIPASSFSDRKELTSVNLPDTLTSIGDNAFMNCSKISSLYFPSNLKSIGYKAFYGSGLTEISLPGCQLGNAAFMQNSALKKVTIGEGTLTIPTECFRDCTALESVVLPDSVELIDATSNSASGAFYNCLKLKDVSIGKNIKNIQSNAFHTCYTGLEITFRDGVTAIPASSFSDRYEITKVILPDTLTSIGNSAFSGCSNLSSCNFPSNLKSIEAYAFNNSALTEITLPGCELGVSAFKNSRNLKKVTIGEGNLTIPTECFRDCTALESVVLPDSVELIDATSNSASGAFYNCLKLKDVSIGKNIKNIQSNAFHTCYTGLEITFRDGVTAIPASSFSDRYEITKVILPDTLTSIGNSAFSGCSNLSSCNFPSNLKSIEAYAFNNSALTEITLPGCELGVAAFKNSINLKKVTIGEGTETIPLQCFRDCIALESVVLPDSVKLIDATSNSASGAFYNCPSLKKVFIGQSIESIQGYAFNTRGEELEVTFREGVKTLPSYSFINSSVTSIILPESFAKLSKNDISNCSGLKLIAIQSPNCVIEDSGTTIPSSAHIRGYENSTAQSYAKNYGRVFETFNEDDPIIAYGNYISGVSLTLDGRIGINFYAKLNSKATKVVLTGLNQTIEYSGSKLASAKQPDGSYQFTFSVNATQANKKISLRVYGENGKQLDIYNSNFEKLNNKSADYSVNDYIENVSKYNSNEKLKAMVESLDQYCKAAENYFYKRNHVLNIPDVNITKTNNFNQKFKISLVLNSGTALRIYSDAAKAVRIKGSNEILLEAVKVNDTTQYFEISDITAFNLLNDETVKLDGVTYKICPMDYCALVLANKNSDSTLKDVCKALYNYGVNAKEYKASIEK